MKLIIRGKNLKITEAMNKYAEEKLSKLDRYFKNNDNLTANLLFKIDGVKQKIEITILLNNLTLRVEEFGEDFYAAVDTALDKLERSIIKNKTRIESKKMKAKTDFSFEELDKEKVIDNNNNGNIVKRKQVELKPMDEEEAILQMELIDHDFYVFKNKDNNKTCVLYRRKNGDYGLIEEE